MRARASARARARARARVRVWSRARVAPTLHAVDDAQVAQVHGDLGMLVAQRGLVRVRVRVRVRVGVRVLEP